MRLLVVIVFVFMVGCSKREERSGVAEPGDKGPATGHVTVRPAEPPAPVKPEFPPANWTHKDLAEYLTKKGIRVNIYSAAPFNQSERTAAWFFEGADDEMSAVLVFLCASAADARAQAAGWDGAAHAKAHFAFGVATFGGSAPERNAALLKRIAAALE